MNSIKCARCGLKNWVEDGACKRCGEPLAFIEEVRGGEVVEVVEAAEMGAVVAVGEEGVCSFCGTRSDALLCPVCRKPLKSLPNEQPAVKGPVRRFLSSANRVVGAMLVAALLVTGVAYGVARRRAGEALAAKAKVAEALRRAEAFDAPVYLSFDDESSELAPGVRVLMEKGLVSYRLGTTPRTIHYEEKNQETGEVVRREKENPEGGRPYARVELTARGAAESKGWKRRAAEGSEPAGWSVPVGRRELVEVREVRRPRTLAREEYERLPEAARASVPPSVEVVTVTFTWRWKPEQLGHFFDLGSDDHRSLSPPAQESARAFRLNDSAKIRAGTAALVYENGQPVVRAVLFEDDRKK